MDVISALLEISVYSAVIYFAVMLIKKLLGNKMSPALHYAIWALLIVRLMMPFTIDSSVRLFVIPDGLPQAQPTVQYATPSDDMSAWPSGNASASAATSSAPTDAVQTLSEQTAAGSVDKTAPAAWAWPTGGILIAVWLAGLAAALAYISVTYAVFRRRIRRNAASPTAHLEQLFAQCKQEMGIKRPVRLMGVYDLATPALFVPPAVLVPPEIEAAMDDKQLTLVLRHELTHFKRGDHIQSMLMLALQAIYWFNPFVWLAFRQMRTDMEVACDSAVAKPLDGNGKSEYASMIISMFSAGLSGHLVLGMAQGDSKKVAEKRLRGIFANGRSQRSAVLAAALLAVVLLVSCFTTACQPTPEQPVVMNKRADIVDTVQQADALPENSAALAENKKTVAEQIGETGGRVTLELKPSDSVTINVDADIVMPEYESIPMVRVKPENFSKEQFDAFISYLTGGKPLYYFPDDPTVNRFTKEEITDMLTQIQACLADDSLPKDVRSAWEYRAEHFKEELNNAMSQAQEKPYDGELTPAENNGTFSSITSLKCYMGKTRAAWLSLWQTPEGNETGLQFDNNDYVTSYNSFEPYEGTDASRLKTTYEQAKAKVMDFVHAVDGADSSLVIYDSTIGYQIETLANYTKETSPQAYAFKLARSYNGVLVKPMRYLWGVKEKEINYSKQVFPESLYVVMDDSGITDAYWGSYTEYIEDVADDVPLKDFDSIKQIFEDYCRYKFTWTYRNDALAENATPNVTLNVKRVEMNLMVIPEKDNFESYITVPVWDFIGDMTLDQQGEMQEGGFDPGQQDVSILTINAIDGSVIDREQGY
jgi:beta-lactamase regulating signal transducer with metallopeptidase domain